MSINYWLGLFCFLAFTISSPLQGQELVHYPFHTLNIDASKVADARHKFNTTHTFFVATSNGREFLTADLKYGDEKSACYIYVKEGEVASANWQALGKQIDELIIPTMRSLFGEFPDVDHNGHIVFLYYKFSPQDKIRSSFFYEDLNKYPKSNRMEVVYMNLNAGDPQSSLMKETLVHQLQHLIAFNERVIARHLPLLPTDLDEWMSKKAWKFFLEKNPEFIKNPYVNEKTLNELKNKEHKL